jgi:hypothetical protein
VLIIEGELKIICHHPKVYSTTGSLVIAIKCRAMNKPMERGVYAGQRLSFGSLWEGS